jgi:hypothetical protein
MPEPRKQGLVSKSLRSSELEEFRDFPRAKRLHLHLRNGKPNSMRG